MPKVHKCQNGHGVGDHYFPYFPFNKRTLSWRIKVLDETSFKTWKFLDVG